MVPFHIRTSKHGFHSREQKQEGRPDLPKLSDPGPWESKDWQNIYYESICHVCPRSSIPYKSR